MRVLITGGSGFIGRALVSTLLNSHQVFVYTHKTAVENNLSFPPTVTVLTADSDFPKVDAIVNLSGEAIDKSFLTRNRIASIINSRLHTIKLLKQKYQNDFPKIFIQASATGIYKDSNEELTENGSFNNNFYAKLVTQIENGALALLSKDCFVYLARLGVVVGNGGGIVNNLKYLPRPYFLMENNYIPYITLEDTALAFKFLLEHHNLCSFDKPYQIVNFCSKNYLTLNELLKLCKPQSKVAIPCPKFILRLDKRGHLLLVDHKVKPAFLLKQGLKFS